MVYSAKRMNARCKKVGSWRATVIMTCSQILVEDARIVQKVWCRYYGDRHVCCVGQAAVHWSSRIAAQVHAQASLTCQSVGEGAPAIAVSFKIRWQIPNILCSRKRCNEAAKPVYGCSSSSANESSRRLTHSPCC
jgi:hypothetical protein